MANTKQKKVSRFGEPKTFELTLQSGALTGFSRVMRPDITDRGTEEYSLQLGFDPNSQEGKTLLAQLQPIIDANAKHELALLEESGKTGYSAASPLKEVNTSELTSNGKPANPAAFQDGFLKFKTKSGFQPSIFGSVSEGDSGDTYITKMMDSEIPIGSSVRVKLKASSYQNPASKTVGTTFYLNAVKILKLGEKSKIVSPFEDDDDVEVLNLGSSVNEDFDESIGID